MMSDRLISWFDLPPTWCKPPIFIWAGLTSGFADMGVRLWLGWLVTDVGRTWFWSDTWRFLRGRIVQPGLREFIGMLVFAVILFHFLFMLDIGKVKDNGVIALMSLWYEMFGHIGVLAKGFSFSSGPNTGWTRWRGHCD